MRELNGCLLQSAEEKKQNQSLPLAAVTSAGTYTWKIDLAVMQGVVTRARGERKRVQGFLSVDPLASQYPGISSYAMAANNPILYADPNGTTFIVKNGADAQRLVNSLNQAWRGRKALPVEGGHKLYDQSIDAFSLRMTTREVTVANPAYENLSNWEYFKRLLSGDLPPETLTKTETVFEIVTNDDFDWNQDAYSKAMFDLANTNSDIIVEFADGSGTKTVPHKYGHTHNPNLIGIDRTLDNGKHNQFSDLSIGQTFIHEALYHVSPSGDVRPSGDDRVNQTRLHEGFDMPHTMSHPSDGTPSNRNRAPLDPVEAQRLEKLREKTGPK